MMILKQLAVIMLVNQITKVSSIKTTIKASKRKLFQHDDIETDAPPVTPEQRDAVNQIDHMLFTLQDISANNKQHNITGHAYQMLDLLNQYRADILFEIIEIKKLQQITDLIHQLKISANPQAKSIFNEIELIASVEIAKLARMA